MRFLRFLFYIIISSSQLAYILIMPRSILILHKKRKERKKGEKVVIDEITRRIETTKRTKKGGEKWSKSLIDKLRSYRSLRRHPFLFFPPKRGDQPAILPVVRPAVFLVFENDRDGSFVRLEAGVEVTCIPWQRSLGNPSQRVDASRTIKGGADFSRNLGEQQPFSPRVKETNFLP